MPLCLHIVGNSHEELKRLNKEFRSLLPLLNTGYHVTVECSSCEAILGIINGKPSIYRQLKSSHTLSSTGLYSQHYIVWCGDIPDS